ncbi:MAG: methyltransferase domain-containing protein [Acidobacteriia bacterium]|nr:methyltransferase domain-containing protein [Terriglobia bacterium]
MKRMAQPAHWSVLDLAEGLHLGHGLAALEKLGVLASLTMPQTAKALARKHRLDVSILEAVLQMLALRTDLVIKRSTTYRIAKKYDAVARFMLLQYVGAFGGNAVATAQILRHPESAGKFVDREQHARAFEQARMWEKNTLADTILKLGFDHPLDLGCGGGNMLLSLGTRSPGFKGWGLDSNPWMCAAARKRITAAGLRVQITIFEGDCRDPGKALPASVVKQVRILTATGVANEFFYRGAKDAVAWLKKLSATFPGRYLLIADYYSQLGTSRRTPVRAVALHDFIQAISGQGVPPPDLAEWKKIYRAAHCRLVRVQRADSPLEFIHMLKL